MKLYEINAELLKCVKVDEDTYVNEETGEAIDVAAIDALLMEREDKVLNIARWIKDLTAEADAIKAEKLKLEQRQRAANNKVESLKEYLTKMLAEGETIKDANTVVKWRKSTSTDVDMLKLMASPERLKYVTYGEPKANKTEIAKALKNGIPVPGCALVTSNKVVIG